MKAMILSPDQALLLLTMGLLLCIWEGCRPGTVVPGAMGAAAILTGAWLLSSFDPAPKAAIWVLAGIACAAAAIFVGQIRFLLPAAAALLAAGVHALFPEPRQIGWFPNLSFVTVLCLGIGPLARLAWRARRLKRSY